MPTVTQVRIRGLKNNYRVTLYAKEGTYTLSVPNTRLGQLLLPVARQNPITVRVKPPVAVSALPRGVKPVGKAAPKVFTYTPLRIRKKADEATTPPTPSEGKKNKTKSSEGKKNKTKSGSRQEVAATVPASKSKRKQKAALVA